MNVSSIVPSLGTDDTFVYIFPSHDAKSGLFGDVSMSDVRELKETS